MSLSDKKIEEFNRITHDFFDFLFEMSEVPSVVQKHSKSLNNLITGVKEISKYFNSLKAAKADELFRNAQVDALAVSNVIHAKTFAYSSVNPEALENGGIDREYFQRKLEEHILTINSLKIENEKLKQRLNSFQDKILGHEKANTQLSEILVLANSEIKYNISRNHVDRQTKETLERLFRIFEKLIQTNLLNQQSPISNDAFLNLISQILEPKGPSKEFTLNPNGPQVENDEGDKMELLYLLTLQAQMIERKMPRQLLQS
jgi:hypothetical protein